MSGPDYEFKYQLIGNGGDIVYDWLRTITVVNCPTDDILLANLITIIGGTGVNDLFGNAHNVVDPAGDPVSHWLRTTDGRYIWMKHDSNYAGGTYTFSLNP